MIGKDEMDKMEKQLEKILSKETSESLAKWRYDFQKKREARIAGKVPVTRGCSNPTCFCTGECHKIIGYRDKLSGEL